MITSYQEIRQLHNNIYGWRKKMVELALEIGIKPAAKEFSCKDDTVRKWFSEYKLKGLDGLLGKKPGPRNPKKIPQATEDKIVGLRKRMKNKIGPQGIKAALDLTHSTSTIYRVLNDHGLTGKRKKKHHKKKDLREIKAKLRPFEKVQIDVKYLDDIPQYFACYLQHKLPRFQFTARDEKTGAAFVSYAYEKTNINAASFATYVMEHLKRHGIAVSEINIQTDNGTEFAGNWTPKSASVFSQVIQEGYSATHLKIPRGRPNVNADVESFHRLIEDFFYDLEEFSSKIDLLNKAYTFQLFFNYFRPNTYKWNKTPLKILNEANAQIDPAVLSLPPIILDYHSMLYLRKLNPSVKVDRYEKMNLSGVPLITDYPVFSKFLMH